MRVRALQNFALEVVVRNIAAGSLCQQTGLPLGTVLKQPLVEFYYKMINWRSFVDARSPLATPEQVEQISGITN